MSENLVPGKWGNWGDNLFTNTQDYFKMRSSIIKKDLNYQYFSGLAFPKENKTKVENYIDAEIMYANLYMNEIASKVNRKDSETPFADFLEQKIYDFETKEMELYQNLLSGYEKKNKKKLNLPLLTHNMQPREKMKSWDQLMLNTIFSKLEFGNNGNILLDGPDALYCFLMSDELYKKVKNTPKIKTVLSRESWERGYYTKRYDYKKNIKKLENEMWNMFKTDDKRTKKNITQQILNGFSKALDDTKIQFTGTANKEYFMSIISSNYEKMKAETIKKMNTLEEADYTLWHDNLKNWGAETFVFLKQKLEDFGYDADKLMKVEVKANKVTFFTIMGATTEDADALADGLVKAIFNFITECANIAKNNKKGFPLTVLPFKKRYFAEDTAKNALIKARGYLNIKNAEAAITKYVAENEGSKALKNSNSVLSGVLGEIANSLAVSRFKVEAELTGNQQQYYLINEKTGRAALTYASTSNMYQNGGDYAWKSSGQLFSDMSLYDAENRSSLLTGINIKRYIMDKNSFTLTSFQSSGLNLKDINLRRYLSEKEILLLMFLQSNEKLIKNSDGYTQFDYNLSDMAKYIMSYNITSILRITGGQGQLDLINYLIAANGHFIPASAVLQYAYNEIINSGYKLFEIKNTEPFVYQSIDKNFYNDENYGIQHADERLDIKNLLTYNVYRENISKGLTFRFNRFKVSIRDLKKL